MIIVSLLPSLFSLWVIRKTSWRRPLGMRQAAMNLSERAVGEGAGPRAGGEGYYLEGVGYLIGDISCRFNARSGYVRCAVNPCGPCEGCRYYEPKE
ncbi:DUF6464 family protein [Umezakia ovalisporum]